MMPEATWGREASQSHLFFSADMQLKWPVSVMCLHWRAKPNPFSEGKASDASGMWPWSSFPQKVMKYVHLLIRSKCQSVHHDGRLPFPLL